MGINTVTNYHIKTVIRKRQFTQGDFDIFDLLLVNGLLNQDCTAVEASHYGQIMAQTLNQTNILTMASNANRNEARSNTSFERWNSIRVRTGSGKDVVPLRIRFW